jgi:DNA-binding transcriptional LysR family regulator
MARTLKFKGQLEFQPMAGREVTEALVARRVELGISQHPLDSLNFIRKPVLKNGFQIIAPSSWSLESDGFRQLLTGLLAKPYIGYSGSDVLPQVLAHHGLDPHHQPHRAFPFWPAIVQMVESKFGWALVPSTYADQAKGLHVFDVPDRIVEPRQFYVIYPKELSRLQWFTEVIQQVLDLFD